MSNAQTSKGPIKAVIFDMDGLLLDTEGIYTDVTNTIANWHGKTFDWSVKQHSIGRGSQDFAEYVIRALELPMSPEEFLTVRQPMLDERFPDAQPMRCGYSISR